MQRLRQATVLARWVLVWFALSLGAAMASPLVKPQAMQLVCSAAGTAKLLPADGGEDSGAGHLLDCPLCAASGVPPSTAMQPQHVAPEPPLAFAAATPVERRGARAPLPARGPPPDLA